jgi:hypothetical protein
MKHPIFKIILAGLWITVSEFLRNEVLFKSYWINHFNGLGLKFTTTPINGILWMIWSFILAYLIFKLLTEFTFMETFIIAWLSAFVMMWIVIFNLQVLPMKLLVFAVPLSILEIVVAILMIGQKKKGTSSGRGKKPATQ